jgi:hypothetical protein
MYLYILHVENFPQLGGKLLWKNRTEKSFATIFTKPIDFRGKIRYNSIEKRIRQTSKPPMRIPLPKGALYEQTRIGRFDCRGGARR